MSAGLAWRWQLPETVVDALRHHHAPFDNDVYEPLAGVLHLAAGDKPADTISFKTTTFFLH